MVRQDMQMPFSFFIDQTFLRRLGEKCDEIVQKCEKFKKILQIVKKVFAIMENMCYNEKVKE